MAYSVDVPYPQTNSQSMGCQVLKEADRSCLVDPITNTTLIKKGQNQDNRGEAPSPHSANQDGRTSGAIVGWAMRRALSREMQGFRNERHGQRSHLGVRPCRSRRGLQFTCALA